MACYYYSPYNDSKMREFASALATKKNQVNKMTKHQLITDLSKVGHFDNLYLLIHGGSGIIGWKEFTYYDAIVPEMFGGGTVRTEQETVHLISPDDLVKNLLSAGLSNKFFNLKFMACHGAEVFSAGKSTAEMLKDALTRKGISRPTIFGYKGTMDVTVSEIMRDPHKKVDITGKGNQSNLVRAKNHRVKF